MPDDDLLLQTVEAVYASGLDIDRLPEALETITRLLGATTATLEVIDKVSQRPSEFWSVGLPALARIPYVDHFATLSPRAPFSFRHPVGHVRRDNDRLRSRTSPQSQHGLFAPQADTGENRLQEPAGTDP